MNPQQLRAIYPGMCGLADCISWCLRDKLQMKEGQGSQPSPGGPSTHRCHAGIQAQVSLSHSRTSALLFKHGLPTPCFPSWNTPGLEQIPLPHGSEVPTHRMTDCLSHVEPKLLPLVCKIEFTSFQSPVRSNSTSFALDTDPHRPPPLAQGISVPSAIQAVSGHPSRLPLCHPAPSCPQPLLRLQPHHVPRHGWTCVCPHHSSLGPSLPPSSVQELQCSLAHFEHKPDMQVGCAPHKEGTPADSRWGERPRYTWVVPACGRGRREMAQ